MWGGLTATTLVLVALLLDGCATVPEVVATYDASGNVQTEPLREVVPKPQADDPQVIGWVNNQGSSMEGTVSFMKATGVDGTVVLDRVIHGDADAQTLPPGSYTLTEYWRDCGGNCDFLGYARQVCSVKAVLAAGGRYQLVLLVRPPDAGPYPDNLEADCTLNAAATSSADVSPQGGITATAAADLARSHVIENAKLVSAVAGKYRDVATIDGAQGRSNDDPDRLVWVVTFSADFEICPPNGAPCWSARPGQTQVILDYFTGNFLKSATFAPA